MAKRGEYAKVAYIVGDEQISRPSNEQMALATGLVWNFADGSEVRALLPTNQTALRMYALHGQKQRGSDEYAGYASKGIEGSVAADEVRAILERMAEDPPRWSESRAGGERQERVTYLALALVRMYAANGKTLDEGGAQGIVAGWSDDFRKAIASEKGAKVAGTLVRNRAFFAALQAVKLDAAKARAASAKAAAKETGAGEDTAL